MADVACLGQATPSLAQISIDPAQGAPPAGQIEGRPVERVVVTLGRGSGNAALSTLNSHALGTDTLPSFAEER